MSAERELAELEEVYQAWLRRRGTLEAREAEGDIPSASDWEASDDDAVALMLDMAAALGFDGEPVDETDGTWPWGRCDTCGAPCSSEGCTVDLTHETAIG